MNKSKPISVKYIEQFNQGNKLWNKWGIKMENGDVGYYHTTQENQDVFVKGKEVEYEFEANVYEDNKGNKTIGKIKKPSTKKNFYDLTVGERVKIKLLEQIASVPSFAASYAKDIIASKGDFGRDKVLFKNESEEYPGDYRKLYNMISSLMYEDYKKASQTIQEILKKWEG